MRPILLLLVIATVAAAEAPLRTLAQGSSGSFPEDARAEVRFIADGAALAEAWALIHAGQQPVPPVPAVDFGSAVVVAALDQARPSGGYAVTVQAVEVGPDGIERACIRTCVPGPAVVTTAALERPYHLVEVTLR